MIHFALGLLTGLVLAAAALAIWIASAIRELSE
jgi:hypothetical protein